MTKQKVENRSQLWRCGLKVERLKCVSGTDEERWDCDRTGVVPMNWKLWSEEGTGCSRETEEMANGCGEQKVKLIQSSDSRWR